MNVSFNLSSLLQTLEKLAAYFGIGGIGVANVPNLPIGVRAVLAGLSSALVVIDRTAIAPTTTAVPPVKPPA